jgi:hypothetical protein
MIFATENSNKNFKARFWKQELVEDMVILGPMAHATLISIETPTPN